MPRSRGAHARRWWVTGGLMVSALALLHVPAHALGRVRIAGNVAHTFAILGSVSEGGPAFSLNATVPIGGESATLRAGLGLWADDMGQQIARLVNPKDLTDLGSAAGRSQFAAGGGLAADFQPALGRAGGGLGVLRGLFLGGTAGIYRVETRRPGRALQTGNAVGWSLASGCRFRMGRLGTLGPSVHYHRVFDDQLGRFMAAGLDWTGR